MTVTALVVSILALLVSGVAAVYSALTSKETRRQADAAQAEIHLAYSPILTVTLKHGSSSNDLDLLYEVRNDGRQDLDSVVVQRPETPDRVRYPVARLGTEFDDHAELGPLPMGASSGLVLRVGATKTLPEFRVRVPAAPTVRTGH